VTLLIPELLTTKTYPFGRIRRTLESLGLQEGVYDAGDYKVTQRGAGANKSVDIDAGRGWVRGDNTARQGNYHAENDAIVNRAVPDNTSGNPRVDQAILRIYDSSVIGGGLDQAEVEILQGTPTAGATLDNAAGVTSRAALPLTAIRLGEWVTPTGFTSITNAIIRDRRPFARGAYWRTERFANGLAGNDYTTASAVFGAIDNTNLTPRIECTGMPLRVTMRARIGNDTAGAYAAIVPAIDGAVIGNQDTLLQLAESAGASRGGTFSWDITPAAGSRTITFFLRAIGGGTARLYAQLANPLQMSVEEILRPISYNG
jgi:hypothetical protein